MCGVLLLLGLYLLVAFVAFLRSPQAHSRYPMVGRADFSAIAHRGGMDIGPENTLKVFQDAVKLGVDVLEMDVRLSADRELVVHHDPTVDRTTDGLGHVDSLTLQELQNLDAGHRWTRDGRTFPFRKRGYMIPRLRDVFATFPEQRMLVELKGRQEEGSKKLCDAVRDAGMVNRVVVGSFHAEAVLNFRRLCPEVVTCGGFTEVTAYSILHLLRLGNLYHSSFGLFSVPEKFGRLTIVDQRFVDEAHKRHLPVQVWTVNDEESMHRLINLGVDGIITDRPDLLLQVLRRRGMR